jgi:hypothetical protein
MEVRIRPLPSLMRMMGHRTTNHAVPAPATEAEDVVAWRRRRLERAGFDRALADSLAADRRADVHALLELVDRGCPPHLAGRILAPLDGDPVEPR